MVYRSNPLINASREVGMYKLTDLPLGPYVYTLLEIIPQCFQCLDLSYRLVNWKGVEFKISYIFLGPKGKCTYYLFVYVVCYIVSNTLCRMIFFLYLASLATVCNFFSRPFTVLPTISNERALFLSLLFYFMFLKKGRYKSFLLITNKQKFS